MHAILLSLFIIRLLYGEKYVAKKQSLEVKINIQLLMVINYGNCTE